ncbi:MAG: hypothetical protein M1829_005768 [Trizodia sp. TS-e1964]|nr:MAG: hypothetical protein M1829_005768 [Trizodia sp. TS-e1964]
MSQLRGGQATTLNKTALTTTNSWEDEAASDDNSLSTPRTALNPAGQGLPKAPPPTPISPSLASSSPFSTRSADLSSAAVLLAQDPFANSSPRAARRAGGPQADTRPEKTDAVAQRMIAGALGVRTPKRSDEQREYDRAVRESELKRRTAEKEQKRCAEEDAARAKLAVWED